MNVNSELAYEAAVDLVCYCHGYEGFTQQCVYMYVAELPKFTILVASNGSVVEQHILQRRLKCS